MSILPVKYCGFRMGASDRIFEGKSTFMVELVVRRTF